MSQSVSDVYVGIEEASSLEAPLTSDGEFKLVCNKFFADGQEDTTIVTGKGERKNRATLIESSAAFREATLAKEDALIKLAGAEFKIRQLELALTEMQTALSAKDEELLSVHALYKEKCAVVMSLAQGGELAVTEMQMALSAKDEELSNVHALYKETRAVAESLAQRGKETIEEICTMERKQVVMTLEVADSGLVSRKRSPDFTEANEETSSTAADSEGHSDRRSSDLRSERDSGAQQTGPASPTRMRSSAMPLFTRSLVTSDGVRSGSPMRIVAPIRGEAQKAWGNDGQVPQCMASPTGATSPQGMISPPTLSALTPHGVMVCRKNTRNQSVSPVRDIRTPHVLAPTVQRMASQPISYAAGPLITSPLRERPLAKTLWTLTRAPAQTKACPRVSAASPLRSCHSMSVPVIERESSLPGMGSVQVVPQMLERESSFPGMDSLPGAGTPRFLLPLRGS